MDQIKCYGRKMLLFLVLKCLVLWSETNAADVITKPHSIDALKHQIKNLPWTYDTIVSKRMDRQGFYDWDFYGRWRFFPWDEYAHYPGQTTSFKVPPPLSREIEGEDDYTLPEEEYTPDFRIPEPPYRVLENWYTMYVQEDRYYRISPMYLQLMGRYWKYNMIEQPRNLGCYCVTVFRRLTPLGMCAILTLRHVVTTASSTDLILRRPRYKKKKTMVNILGFWYETDTWKMYWENASYYASPARITYHPKWVPPDYANRSNPFPVYYDLSVWATTYQLINPGYIDMVVPWYVPSSFVRLHRTVVCGRCSGTTPYPFDSPGLGEKDLTILVGTQFVMDIGRHPFPWFKYIIRTTSGKRNPCPKNEWGWFHCIEMTGQVGKLGHESGGILHIAYRWFWNRRYSGLAGLNSFSMRLRSKYFVNYYTVTERHSVLDYFYHAYMGVTPWVYKDFRFNDTKWRGAVYINWWYNWRYRQNDHYYYYNPNPENVSALNTGTLYQYLPVWYGWIYKGVYEASTSPYVPIWW